ncbi:hypothetical protein [Methylobacterium pseudosasicola]|uniref:Uncharacterized protein n=1 Tax=Methylobacterium pseudosasicola TaxID=582667 RepID=A0A1I4QMA5_9HYPH|nr:hypothetical protein [Methylobacterium pseudosasicola]SFM41177.1 hypothetical protein SAMN05192568_103064 [Methylobacterium pseudosasicola]
MENTDSLTLIAARIRGACDTYRICGLIGRGCLERVRLIDRLVEAGRIDPVAGVRLAREAEAVAFMLAPIPGGHS